MKQHTRTEKFTHPNKKLYYCRGTAWPTLSVRILSTGA